MTEFYKNGALRARYDYNAFGQRIRKTTIRPLEDGEVTKQLNFAYTPDGWLLSQFWRIGDSAALITPPFTSSS